MNLGAMRRAPTNVHAPSRVGARRIAPFATTCPALLRGLEGRRGEGWVAVQALLLLANGAATFRGPRLPPSVRVPARLLGLGAIISGGGLLLAGGLSLGRDLTPLPRPKAGARLVRTGPYQLVRHPIYSGLLIAGFGWALLHGRWLGLLAAASLVPFFDAKATREEAWLVERFADYPAYRQRVAKLLPGVY